MLTVSACQACGRQHRPISQGWITRLSKDAEGRELTIADTPAPSMAPIELGEAAGDKEYMAAESEPDDEATLDEEDRVAQLEGGDAQVLRCYSSSLLSRLLVRMILQTIYAVWVFCISPKQERHESPLDCRACDQNAVV